jgi:hypothetical protein
LPFFLEQVNGTVDAASRAKECRYSFDASKAIQRIRFPKFVAHVRALLGEKSEKVFEAVVDHGRVTFSQLRASCPQLSDDSLKETADQLLREKYIIRVIASPNRPSSAETPIQPTPSKLSSGSKKRKADDTDLHGQKGASSKLRRGDGDSSRAGLANEEPVSEESVAYESVTIPGSVWCVNAIAFEWDFRALAIAQLMADRYGQATASLMKVLLKAVRNRALQPTSSHGNRAYAASVDTLISLHKLSAQEGQEMHVAMTWEALSEALSALSQDSFHSVQKIHDGGPDGVLYRPQVAELITHLQRQLVEHMIEKRFTFKGRRLFRLLMDRSRPSAAGAAPPRACCAARPLWVAIGMAPRSLC